MNPAQWKAHLKIRRQLLEIMIVANQTLRHCVRAVKEMDSKSIGLCPQGFESPRCRLTIWYFFTCCTQDCVRAPQREECLGCAGPCLHFHLAWGPIESASAYGSVRVCVCVCGQVLLWKPADVCGGGWWVTTHNKNLLFSFNCICGGCLVKTC